MMSRVLYIGVHGSYSACGTHGTHGSYSACGTHGSYSACGTHGTGVSGVGALAARRVTPLSGHERSESRDFDAHVRKRAGRGLELHAAARNGRLARPHFLD